jgi:hypothetical protein
MCARAQGLRTLLLATRILGADEWAAWNARYQAAAGSLDAREQRIAQARHRPVHALSSSPSSPRVLRPCLS